MANDNMTVGEKVSYIKGLAEGLNVDGSTKEGKIICAMLDVLSDIALSLETLDDEMEDVYEAAEDLEESVSCLEDEVYGDEEDYDDEDEDDEDFDELDDMYEATCPNCSNTIRFDYEQASKGGFDCPNCGKHLQFELEDDDAE